MTARRASGRAPTPAEGNLRRSAAWAGLRRGDAVSVTGTRIRFASWEFIAHVRNVATGEEWVEVVGGKPGDRKVRSFRPDQVFPPPRRGGPGASDPSLAEAPRLPLL